MAAARAWIGVGFVALGAAVAGAYVHERLTPTAPAEPVVHSLSTPSGPAAIPERRPDFTLRDPAGRLHSIGEWDGRPLLINFWASWCAPCRREIPLLNRLQAQPPLPDLQVIGIAVDFPADVAAFLKQVPVGYPILIGEQDGLDAASAFGVQAMAFPFSIFIDRRGRVLSLHMGELHENQARATLGVLARVDAGELGEEAAREALKAALSALPSPAPSG